MQPDPDTLRKHFAELSDEALLEINSEDLTEVAQQYYDAEIKSRGIADEPQSEPDREGEELVLLTTFLSPTEADLATALLRSANIPANLENEHSSQWTGFGGLRLMVPASLLGEAREILESQISDEDLATEAEAAHAEDSDTEANGKSCASLSRGLPYDLGAGHFELQKDPMQRG